MAKAEVDIWMPLYVADYLADTNRLTTVQHGAYLLLLIDYWRNGALPNEKTTLLQVTRLPEDAWSMLEALLRQYFELSTSNTWVHAKAELELAKAKANKSVAVNRATKAAQKRWENVRHNSNALPQALPEQCPSPSPSPSPSPLASTDANCAGAQQSQPQLRVIAGQQELSQTDFAKLVAEHYFSVWGTRPPMTLQVAMRIDLLVQSYPKAKDPHWWRAYFECCRADDFLSGEKNRRENRKPFRADFMYLLRDDVFTRVVDQNQQEAANG